MTESIPVSQRAHGFVYRIINLRSLKLFKTFMIKYDNKHVLKIHD